jgi:hypothetical protein
MEKILIFILFVPEITSLLIFTTMMTWEKIFPKEDIPHDEYCPPEKI